MILLIFNILNIVLVLISKAERVANLTAVYVVFVLGYITFEVISDHEPYKGNTLILTTSTVIVTASLSYLADLLDRGSLVYQWRRYISVAIILLSLLNIYFYFKFM